MALLNQSVRRYSAAIRERRPWNVVLSLRRWRDRRHRWWEKKENQIAARPPRSLWEAHKAATVPLTSARSTSTLPSHSQPRSLHLVSISLFLSPVSVFLWTPSHGLQVHITGMETGNERWHPAWASVELICWHVDVSLPTCGSSLSCFVSFCHVFSALLLVRVNPSLHCLHCHLLSTDATS